MDTFSAIADPVRRALLDAMLAEPLSVNDLVRHTGSSQPVVSKHLKILREARLVKVTPAGQRRFYAIDPQGLAAVEAWLTPYRQIWAGRLDKLVDLIEHTGDKDA